MLHPEVITPFETIWVAAITVLLGAGVLSLTCAVVYERRMQRHRQPGVSYWQVTLRRDGAWRRADLFTERGLELQRRAAQFGMAGGALLLLGVILMGVMRFLP